MASLKQILIASTIIVPAAAIGAYHIYAIAEPNGVQAAAPEKYTDTVTSIRMKAVRIPYRVSAFTAVVPGISYKPAFASSPAAQSFYCGGVSKAANPVGWLGAEANMNLESGQRGLRQNGADLAFFDLAGGMETAVFKAGGFCDFNVGHITDKPNDEPLATGDKDIVLPVKVFKGEVPSGKKLSLFDGNLEVWTSSYRQGAGFCALRVRFNKQAGQEVDFTHKLHPQTKVFYLRQNDRDVYKFDMRQSSGQKRFGGCETEITHMRLPAVPNVPARIYKSGGTAAPRPAVAGYDMQQGIKNISVNFSDATRVVQREKDTIAHVDPHTRQGLSRSFTSAQEISFSRISSTGVDVSSPILSMLTLGLLDVAIKKTWDSRFTQAMSQSTTTGTTVFLDGDYCTQWKYSVSAVVRDGYVIAPDFGLKEPLGFTITERYDITNVTPLCPSKGAAPVLPKAAAM